MMGMSVVPKEVTERLDKLEGNMASLVEQLLETNDLLREQNELLRSKL